MEPNGQQEGRGWDNEYSETVYAVIDASRAVAITAKDWQVIASQCESIRGYRDVDQIYAEALQQIAQLQNQPDIDLLIDEQIKQRVKKQRIILLLSAIGVSLCISAGIALTLHHKAQRKQILAEVSESAELLQQFAPEALEKINGLVNGRDYANARDTLIQSRQRALDLRQKKMNIEREKALAEAKRKKDAEEAERRKVQAETERQREAVEAERRRLLAEEERQQQLREAEQNRLAEEAARLRRIEEEKRLETQRRLAEIERVKQAEADALRRAELARQEAEAQRLAEVARLAQVSNGLAAAKAAFDAKQWKKLLGHATEVLAVDKDSKEASEYKQAAEYYLYTPFVTLIATVDGKDVPAQVILDKTYATPATLPLVHGGIYQIKFLYANGGRKFNAQLRLPVPAEWMGERTMRVELFEVLAPVKGKDWVSPATGMVFVWVDALKVWVGKFEVTNGEFRKKEPLHSSKHIRDIKGNAYSLNEERQPVVFINFNEAVAFAQWLTQMDMGCIAPGSYRLPTMDEFTHFSTCGDPLKPYPWGDMWPPTTQAGNYDDEKVIDSHSLQNYKDGSVVTCAVEESGKNGWGLFGVAGNVWECCTENVERSEFGGWRGASWTDASDVTMKCMFKSGAAGGVRNEYSGFRLVFSP